MIKPIPKSLLIHSASYVYGRIKDSWSNPTGGTTISLTQVRVEPSTALKLSKDNKQVQLSAVLFFDCKNSLPVGTTFALGEAIVFNSKTYNIESIDPLYSDAENIHHYEVGLS